MPALSLSLSPLPPPTPLEDSLHNRCFHSLLRELAVLYPWLVGPKHAREGTDTTEIAPGKRRTADLPPGGAFLQFGLQVQSLEGPCREGLHRLPILETAAQIQWCGKGNTLSLTPLTKIVTTSLIPKNTTILHISGSQVF